jgi:hypothetical protein
VAALRRALTTGPKPIGAPTVRAARAQGNVYYLYDTLWTPRGAIAGFNVVAAATRQLDSRKPDLKLGARATDQAIPRRSSLSREILEL